MTKTRNLSDLLDSNGDVKSTALDNVPASNDASALTTGTLDNARLSAVPNSALANSSITINGTATALGGSATINTDLINDTTPQLGGNLDCNTFDISFGDNEKARFGNADDLQIYHDGANSYIKDVGTGNLNISANQLVIKNSAVNEAGLIFTENGALELYYDDSKKLETTSAGATVTGTLTATAFSGDGSGLTNVPAGVSSVKLLVYGSSTTYTPTSGTKFVKVWCTGGGGGSGGNFPTSSSHFIGAGGGGGGGTAIRVYTASELGSSATITIGSGGGGGHYDGGGGGTGGTTTFDPAGTGTTIYGYGGSGGYGLSSQSGATPAGEGGTAAGGQINQIGGYGVHGEGGTTQIKYGQGTLVVASGSGGNTFWGHGGRGRISTGYYAGETGTYGGGASGHAMRGTGSNQNGVTGGSGVVVIMEFA